LRRGNPGNCHYEEQSDECGPERCAVHINAPFKAIFCHEESSAGWLLSRRRIGAPRRSKGLISIPERAPFIPARFPPRQILISHREVDRDPLVRGGTARISLSMKTYQSGAESIAVDQREPEKPGAHPAILVLHGSMGAGSYWLGGFALTLSRLGIAAYAPRYLQKTGSLLATSKKILDGKHFPAWLAAVRDAVSYVAERPGIDARRIGVLGFSLGGYLAMALAAEGRRIRTVIELSGGLPPGWEDQVSKGMAPVLALHGANDGVDPVLEAYKVERVLKEHGVACELEVFPGESHWITGAAQARLLMRCAEFLKKNL
jgi:carboxymethylenebutenolidase